MHDTVDLGKRLTDAKQALLLALRHANAAVVDGHRDVEDIRELEMAFEQAKRARDAIDILLKRLTFLHDLERIRSGAANDESSRGMITLVRRGVDGGFAVDEGRRMIDEAMGKPSSRRLPAVGGTASFVDPPQG